MKKIRSRSAIVKRLKRLLRNKKLIIGSIATIVAIICAIFVVPTIIQSDAGLPKEERIAQRELRDQYLADGEAAMEKYLKEKYGQEMNVYDVEVPTYRDIISDKSTGIYQAFAYGKVKHNGKVYDVCIDMNSHNACFDNIQCEEIYNAFKLWLVDVLESHPYYLSFNIGKELSCFESGDGMTNVYYDGDIEQFIKNGGVESVIAFLDQSDIRNVTSTRLSLLSNTDYSLVITTKDKKFGAVEAGNMRFRDMREFYAPYVTGLWECRLGEIDYLKNNLKKIGEAIYLSPSDESADVAISEIAAPTACLEVVADRTDIKKVSMWYYIKADQTILFFPKDKIQGYDQNKDYCVFAAIGIDEVDHKLEVLPVNEIGDYLVVRCEGQDSWYALCEQIGDAPANTQSTNQD